MKQYYVYILASKRNGTLYIGVTGSLLERVDQHKSGLVPGFTKRYGVDKPVHFEAYRNIGDAITREKHLKKWKRQWKITLIEQVNSQWRDLYEELVE